MKVVDRSEDEKVGIKTKVSIFPVIYIKLDCAQFVSMDAIDKICGILDCGIGDVVKMI